MKKFIYIITALFILIVSIAAGNFLFSPFGKDGSLFSPLWKRGGGGDLSAEAAATKTGLVGYWNMDQTDISGTKVYDRSGLNNHGTMAGTSNFGGKIKQARDFNGSSDNIAMTEISSYNATNITVSAWVKFDATGGYQGVVTKRSCLGDPCQDNLSFQWSMQTANDNKMWFGIRTSANTYWVYTNNNATADWEFYTGTYDGETLKIYRNGIFESQDTTPSGDIVIQSGIPVVLGARANGVSPYSGRGDYFNGKIDDLRIYNRALSAQEVTQLYNSAKINYEQTAQKTASSTNSGQLVGYWTMDSADRSQNLIYDRSGFDNNGTLVGTTTSTGRIKEARSFNGTSDYITIANENNFDFERTQPFTLATWIRPGALGSAQILFVKQAGGTAGWLLDIDSANTFNTYFINTWSTNAIQVNSVSTAKLNTWQHVVVTYAGTSAASGVKIYIDGIADNTTTVYDSLSASMLNNQAVWLGRRNHIDNLYFNGRMDDARIYNYAMSAQEVANLYNSAKTNYTGGGDKTGIVAYWPLDQNEVSYRGTSTTTYDKSGYNNHCSFNIGTNTYGATSTVGKVKQALDFDGANDYLDCGNSSILRFGTGAFSVSAWVKYSGTPDYGGVVTYWQAPGDTTYAGYQMRPHPDGTMHVLISKAGPFFVELVSDVALNDGKWHHLLLVNGSTTSHQFYVDGILNDSSTDTTISVTQTLNNFYIGRLVDWPVASNTKYFKGSIDDVRIYNRALSATEVANFYNSAKRNYK